MDGNSTSKDKRFILRKCSGDRKVEIIYRNQEDFLRKVQGHFKVKTDEDVIFMKPGSEIEILAEDIFEEPNGAWFIVKKEPKDNHEDGATTSLEKIQSVRDDSKNQKHTNPSHDLKMSNILKQENNNKPSEDNDPSKASDTLEEDENQHPKWLLDIEKWKTHMDSKGLNGIDKVLKETVDKWKNTPIHIVVIGQSGKGKSTLINTLLGMKVGDEEYTKTGLEETTLKSKKFCHPERKRFEITDTPGVFWANKEKERKFKKEYESDKYDFFLIVTTERTHRKDIEVAENLVGKHKSVYFVRNKFDSEVEGHENYTEEYLLEECRKTTRKAISEMWTSDERIPPLFIISALSKNTHRFDYQGMITAMYRDAPDCKKDCFAFTVRSRSIEMIEAKCHSLRIRGKTITLLIALACAPLLAGVVLPAILPSGVAEIVKLILCCLDFTTLTDEITFYKTQFGLDDDSLTKLAESTGMTLEEFKTEVILKSPLHIETNTETEVYIRQKGEMLLSDKTGKSIAECIPQGQRIQRNSITVVENSFCSYLVYSALELALLEMKEDACRIITYLAKD